MTKNFGWSRDDDAAATETFQTNNSTSHINYKPKPERSNIPQLFINRIPLEWQESHLQKMFSTVGRVNYVRVIPSKSGDQAFGFVGYDTLEEGKEAIRRFNDREASLDPYPTLSVSFSKTGGAKPFNGGASGEGGDRNFGGSRTSAGNVNYYSAAGGADEYNAGETGNGDKGGALMSRRSDTSGCQDGGGPATDFDGDYKQHQRYGNQTSPADKKLSCITNKSETKVFYYGSAKNPWEALQNLNLNHQFKQITPGNYGNGDTFGNAFQQQTPQQQPTFNMGVNYGQQANGMSAVPQGPNDSVVLLSPPEYMARSGMVANPLNAMLMNGQSQRAVPPPTLNVNNCFYCSKPAFFTASCCNQALYCSECCVNSDWTRHRRFCPNSMPEAKNGGLMDGLGNRSNQVIDVTNAFNHMSNVVDPSSFYNQSQIPAITKPGGHNIVELPSSGVPLNEGRFNQPSSTVQNNDRDGYSYNRPQPAAPASAAYDDNDQRQDYQSYKTPAPRSFGFGRGSDDRSRDSNNRDDNSYDGGRKKDNESFYGASTRPYKSSYSRYNQQDDSARDGGDNGDDVPDGPFPSYGGNRGNRGGDRGGFGGGGARFPRGSRGSGSGGFGGFRGGSRGGGGSYSGSNSNRGFNNESGGDTWGSSGGGGSSSYNRAGNSNETSTYESPSTNQGSNAFDDCGWGQAKPTPAASSNSFGGGWGDANKSNESSASASGSTKLHRVDKYADLKANPEISLINNGAAFEEMECGWSTTAATATATSPKWGGDDLVETFDDFHGKGKKPPTNEDTSWKDDEPVVVPSGEAKNEGSKFEGGAEEGLSQFVLEQSDKFQASAEFGIIPPQTQVASGEQNDWNTEEVIQPSNHTSELGERKEEWNNETSGFVDNPPPENNGWEEIVTPSEPSQPEAASIWDKNETPADNINKMPKQLEAANQREDDKEETTTIANQEPEAINMWENEKTPVTNNEQYYETANMWDNEKIPETSGMLNAEVNNDGAQQTQYAATFENGIHDRLIDVTEPLNVAQVVTEPAVIPPSYKESSEAVDMVLEQAYAHLPSDFPFVLPSVGNNNSSPSPYSNFDEIPIPAPAADLLIPSKITPSIRTICEYASDDGEDNQEEPTELTTASHDSLKTGLGKLGDATYKLFCESQTGGELSESVKIGAVEEHDAN